MIAKMLPQIPDSARLTTSAPMGHTAGLTFHSMPVKKEMLMLTSEAVQQLRTSLRGNLVGPGEAGYQAACTLYNAMIDKHPAAIAQCRDAADVMSAVRFAREHELAVAIRGGGHNGAGLGEGHSRRSAGENRARGRRRHLGRG